MFDIKCFATGSTGNCYLISKNGCHILIECGIPIKRIVSSLAKEGLSFNNIDYCLVSHVHKDHSLAYNDVKARMGENKCFMTTKTSPNLSFILKGINISTVSVNHGDCLCNAFILRDDEDILLFATDFNVCEWDLSDFKFTQIMIECNYYEPNVEQGDINAIRHLGLQGTKKHLEKMNLDNCKEIYLIHLSERFSDEIIMRAAIQSSFNIKTYVCKQYGGIK